ncbi:helix-turn-helix domain-containing protein [Nocardioides sp. zg-536]|uniref:Helix-turn-helix domain-containing protein n=1 Tax=Nocardioides faecalis TaxID=2803858 RepID=A0A938XY63_9ACTN|nr:helix-turn-helix domain-containing protein [Nocardioides faecalis]MBM9458341.1 helix-turn-helix domain-containing protein [Nocardioides faecalis]MBS4753358.1 helix-turn-helix domain-containing protein [Nocardioides faecalis]QVI58366.1 helix-turn-helix domain-containing protein [Nocardioides faecalis]
MTVTDDNRPQSVMGRALLLMEPFREADGLTLTDLARAAGLPRSSTHRMLLQLVEVGWLHRRGTTYHLGHKLMELGSLAQRHDRIHRACIGAVHQLHRHTGAAVHLTVLVEDELLCLEKVGGRWAESLGTYVGQRLPAGEGPWGAALLAHRAGTTYAVHEHDLNDPAGRPFRHLSLAFDAGQGERAALSLTHPGEQMPAGSTAALTHAAQGAAELLRTS